MGMIPAKCLQPVQLGGCSGGRDELTSFCENKPRAHGILALEWLGGKYPDATGFVDTEQDAAHFQLATSGIAAPFDVPANMLKRQRVD